MGGLVSHLPSNKVGSRIYPGKSRIYPGKFQIPAEHVRIDPVKFEFEFWIEVSHKFSETLGRILNVFQNGKFNNDLKKTRVCFDKT